ncbi:MAG: zf-HC2 domain-containing protein [Clostridium butyricum]|nr:zf-HC2 domain-containing protein [Clostridium butyricum]
MCSLDKYLLYSYGDETIDELEKIFVEEHLKYCSECRQKLKEIKDFDNELENLNYDDIIFPDKLSVLSELVTENYFPQLEKEEMDMQYSNNKEGRKIIKRLVLEGCKHMYKNSYRRRGKKKSNKYTNVIKNNVKQFCKKKLSKTKMANSTIIKLLKVV